MSTGLFADEENGYNLEETNLEETKYVLKGSAPSTDSSVDPIEEPMEEPMEEPVDDLVGLEDATADDKPFDDEPFDAGVDADEDTDPEKYIQQLSGKLGQSLRQYTEDEGQPDFDLEKFAVNSVLSATHTSEMDKEDQRDIINKVKGAGADEKESEEEISLDVEDNGVDNSAEDLADDSVEEIVEELPLNKGGDEDLEIKKRIYDVINQLRSMGEDITVDNVIMQSLSTIGGTLGGEGKLISSIIKSIDLPNFKHNPDDFDVNDLKRYYDAVVTREKDGLVGRVIRFDDGKLKVKITDGKHSGKIFYAYPSEIRLNTPIGENSTMIRNLKNMKSDVEDILAMDNKTIKDKLKGMEWADDHISTSADDAEEVADYLTTEGDNPCWDGYERVPDTKVGEKGSCRKKTNENLTVSNRLKESEKRSTFVDKTKLVKDLRLMENTEPLVEPKPTTKPKTKPARPMREADRPFAPKRRVGVQPDPKAEDNDIINGGE